MLAAAPEWIEGNVTWGALIVLVIVAVAVLRMVQKLTTRIALVALLVGVGFAVAVQRDEIERCGQTCSCELFGLDVDVPFCSPEFPGS